MTQTKAQEILKTMLDEVEGMDATMFVPHNKLAKGEKVLGEVHDPLLQKMYSLSQMYRRDEHMTKTEMQFINNDDERAEMHRKAHYAEERADVLIALFWYLTQAQFKTFTASIGLREGWTLVKCRKDDGNPIVEILRNLNGGDE